MLNKSNTCQKTPPEAEEKGKLTQVHRVNCGLDRRAGIRCLVVNGSRMVVRRGRVGMKSDEPRTHSSVMMMGTGSRKDLIIGWGCPTLPLTRRLATRTDSTIMSGQTLRRLDKNSPVYVAFH
jgi:hypothetical protein